MNRRLLIISLVASMLAMVILPAAAAPLAAPCMPGAIYDPSCDVDQNGVIDVQDIQLTAGRWGSSGTYVDTSWSLTGNEGTTVGSNFVGTTDNTALEIRVNGQRALRIEPDSSSPNIIAGHANNATSGAYWGIVIGGGGQSGAACGQSGTQPCSNRAYGYFSTIGGGIGNEINALYTTVGGGRSNTANGDNSTIAGGALNQTPGHYAVVAGGSQNSAGGLNAAIGGGQGNQASGQHGTIPGGMSNLASGNYSFAAGRRAKATNAGAFVLADSNNFDLSPGVNNAFTARFTGGVRFITGIDGVGTATWICAVYNGGSWGCSSDRNVKENFQPVDGREVLEKLAALPITTWNAIGTDPGVRRMGPMSQDFYATFGLGDDDKVITTGDLDGVALASIQGLYQIVQEKDAQITALQQENADLQARLAAIEQALGIGP